MTFATLGSQYIKLFNAAYEDEIGQAKTGETITIEPKAALNQNWDKIDKGWV